MDETVEEDVVEEVKEEIIEEPLPEKSPQNALDNKAVGLDTTNNVVNESTSTSNLSSSNSSIKFNDIDYIKDDNDTVTSIVVPKDIENLEKISETRNIRNDDDDDDDDDDVKLDKLNITNQDVTLDSLDIHTLSEPKLELLPELLIDDIEVLT
jgi:hypothetical protein